jgi:hypothetical protein
MTAAAARKHCSDAAETGRRAGRPCHGLCRAVMNGFDFSKALDKVVPDRGAIDPQMAQ